MMQFLFVAYCVLVAIVAALKSDYYGLCVYAILPLLCISCYRGGNNRAHFIVIIGSVVMFTITLRYGLLFLAAPSLAIGLLGLSSLLYISFSRIGLALIVKWTAFSALVLFSLFNGQLLPLIFRVANTDIDKPVAYMRGGVWGDPALKSTNLDIESQYSSSKFVEKTGAVIIDSWKDSKELSQYRALFVFMPTRPLDLGKIEEIRSWVAKGGILYVIADHTDLFGHAATINRLVRPFGLSINSDAIINQPHVAGYYYNAWGGKMVGLTPSSVSGRGDVIFWTWGYSEKADYSGSAFFGDLSPTDGDVLGIHCVGIRSTYGLGEIRTFNDSTFFSNFGIGRFSSNLALETLTSPLPAFPLHDFVILVAVVAVFTRWTALFLGGSGIFLCAFMYFLNPLRSMFAEKGEASYITVQGDPLLVDPEFGPYSALWGGHFLLTDMPLRWKSATFGSGVIEVGDRKLSVNVVGHRKTGRAVESMLGMEMAPSMRAVIASGDFSGLGSLGDIWFDDGVGFLRKALFEAFWKNGKIDIREHGVEAVSFTHLNGRKLPASISGRVHWLTSEKDWALIGEGIVARWIESEGVFLARKSWQVGDWVVPTFIVKKAE